MKMISQRAQNKRNNSRQSAALAVKVQPPTVWFATLLSLVFLGNLALPVLGLFLPQTIAEAAETEARYKGQISIVKEVTMAPQSAKIDLEQRDFPLKDLIHVLAKQGGFNVIVDPEIDEKVTFDVKNVTINKMLDYLIRFYDLSYTQDGNTLIITTRDTANDRQLNVKNFKAIPVKYRDATSTATLLNSILFPGRAGSTKDAIASADAQSNSLLVMGTESDIKAVEEALKQFDVQRHRAVIKVMHATPAYIMQAIQSELFPAGFGGGGAAGGGGGGAAGGGGGGAAGGGAAGGASVVGGDNFSMVANSLTNTVIVQGTPEQIERAQEIAKEVDVQPAQVKIEVALIEISNTKAKVFSPSFGTLRAGEFGINLLGGSAGGFSNAVDGLRSQAVQNNLGSRSFRFPTVGVQFKDQTTSGKLLANPNIIALDGTTSTVNITDSIVYFQTTVTNSGGTVTTQAQPQTQQVGIKLSITPKITNDGSVTLALTPSVTQLLGIVTEPISGTSAPQTSQRDFTLSAVRVRDGETLMIGGLIKDFASKDITKIPGLADLPIVGALFRATSPDPGNVYSRSELIVMVTPHILREEGLPYFGYGEGNQDKDKPDYTPKKPINLQSGGVEHRPVPKFSADELPALQKDADINLGKITLPQPTTTTKRLKLPSESSASISSTPNRTKTQGYNMLNYADGLTQNKTKSVLPQPYAPSTVNQGRTRTGDSTRPY